MSIFSFIQGRLKGINNRWFLYTQTKKQELCILQNRHKKNIYLFCCPIHSNLGDQAQTMCILRWLKKYYYDYNIICVSKQLSNEKTLSLIKKKISNEDKIFIHSGYLICEMYKYIPFICDIIDQFPDNPIIILPQTVNIVSHNMQRFVSNHFNKHKKLTLMCRDAISYKKSQVLFSCRLILYPDFVTSLIGKEEFNFINERNGILFVIRNDKEKLYSDEDVCNLKNQFRSNNLHVDEIDTTISINPFKWNKQREKIIKYYINIFSKYQIVITDRYHGTIFAQIASTPTIVLSTNDYKLESGVKWFPNEEFGERIFFASNLNQAYTKAMYILDNKENSICTSQYFEKNYWEVLYDLLK